MLKNHFEQQSTSTHVGKKRCKSAMLFRILVKLLGKVMWHMTLQRLWV